MRQNADILLIRQQESHQKRSPPRDQIRKDKKFRFPLAPKITPLAHNVLLVLMCHATD